MKQKKGKRIVVVGGGTGVFTVLDGLREYRHSLSAIVTMADNGGSTGVLREEFGILPPGDIRRALIALSVSYNKVLSELFSYRFEEGGGLEGHNFGNLLLTALERITGDFDTAIQEAGKILSTRGEVIPVSFTNTHLYAELENGRLIAGETNIDHPKHNGNLKIKKIFLKPVAYANPRAVDAIMRADLIVIGPGDLYTSIIPNLLVEGIVPALTKTKAKIAYVCNVMTKFGETTGFTAKDFVTTLARHLPFEHLDYVVVNSAKPQSRLLRKYRKEKSELVVNDLRKKYGTVRVCAGNFLREGTLLRHHPQKLAKALISLIA